MSSQQDGDMFAIPKAIFSIFVLAVFLGFVGREGCQQRNPPVATTTVNFTQAPPAGPTTVPYAPDDPEEKRVVEAIRSGGGSIDSDGSLLSIKMPGNSPSADIISQLGFFKHPIVLDLRSSRVTDEDLVAIECVSRLSTLYLDGTPVTDEGVRSIAGLPDLRGLYLSKTRVTDAGVRYIAALRTLRSLTLDETSLSDIGLAELAGMPELSTLSLRSTAVTDAGLEYLPALPKLSFVVVTGSPVSRVEDRRLAGNTFRLTEDGGHGLYHVTRGAEIAAQDAAREHAARPSPFPDSGNSHQSTPSRTIGRRRH
jgi:hypothetical protein